MRKVIVTAIAILLAIAFVQLAGSYAIKTSQKIKRERLLASGQQAINTLKKDVEVQGQDSKFADYRTYRNTEQNFSIKFPKDFSVQENLDIFLKNNVKLIARFQKPAQTNKLGASIDVYVAINLDKKPVDQIANEIGEGKLIKSEGFVVNGLRGTKRVYEVTFEAESTIQEEVIFVESGSKVFIIKSQGTENSEVLNNMLSTLEI